MATSPPAPRRRTENNLLRYGCLALVAGVFCFSLLCSGLIGLDMLAGGPAVLVIASILALTTTIPYTLMLLWLDRNEKEPWYLLATAFLWGALVATGFSGCVNTFFGAVATEVTGNMALGNQLAASFSAPFIEELTKGTAVLVIFALFRKEFDNVLDGILYGALVGLGFAWFENITYYVNAAADGGLGGMITLTWIRGILSGVGSHAAYTGLTGCAFGLVRVMRTGWARWLLIPLFWGTAMFAHFMWNTFVTAFIFVPDSAAVTLLVSLPMAVLVLQAPFLLLLVGVVGVAWRHENKIIKTYLALEPADVVSPAEVAGMFPARRRTLRLWGTLFRKGPVGWWNQRALDSELIELAFARWHHHEDEEVTWSADEDEDIGRLRKRVRARRARWS